MARRSRVPRDGTDRRAATGPQPVGEVPGYEFDGPRSRHDTGEFGRIRDSGGFPRVRGTDGFDAVRDSDGFDAIPDSGEFRAVRDSGGYRAVRGGAERDGQSAPLNVRYTPTIATSGPIGPVPPPAEFSEFTGPRPSGPFPRSRPAERPRPQARPRPAERPRPQDRPRPPERPRPQDRPSAPRR